MRKLAPLLLLALFAAPSAFAQLDRFTGDWQNTNPASRGVVRIEVTAAGADVEVRVWGSCHPAPCDWGMRTATVYGPAVEANAAADARAVSVIYTTKFDEAIVVLKPAGTDLLSAEIFDRFTDRSGRQPFVMAETFRRQ